MYGLPPLRLGEGKVRAHGEVRRGHPQVHRNEGEFIADLSKIGVIPTVEHRHLSYNRGS